MRPPIPAASTTTSVASRSGRGGGHVWGKGLTPAARAVIGAALILVVGVGVVSPAGAAPDYPSGRFVDDDRHPAEAALAWLGESGVIDGCNSPRELPIVSR